MFAVVDDNALEEEQKALHRKKIVDWVDSAAKLPSGCDKHTEGPHSPTPLALDVGTKIIHADPSSSDYTSPNIYTGTVTTAYLDPNDNCLVLYSLVINGTNSRLSCSRSTRKCEGMSNCPAISRLNRAALACVATADAM